MFVVPAPLSPVLHPDVTPLPFVLSLSLPPVHENMLWLLSRDASGHDLRLDETLRRNRRQLVPLSDTPPTLRAQGNSVEKGAAASGFGVEMDWREEIRQASQLPEVGAEPIEQ